MTTYTRAEVASRAGVEPAFVGRLIDLGIVVPPSRDHLSPGDVRRTLLARSLEDAGIPLDGVAAAMRDGDVSLDFLDAISFERIGALATETFRQVSERTAIPLELLTVIREAIGLAPPEPDDLMREEELAVVPFIQLQVDQGFHPRAIERLLRVIGDGTRRITEQEASWWRSEVIEPGIVSGADPQAIANPEFSDRSVPLAEQTLLAMYHAQQGRAWTTNIIEGFEELLERAGLHSRLERPPAICFLDITGYTRLTQERGDDAAADLAATVARLVQRSSVRHAGKPIKWLGDGVMLYFPNPGQAVAAAIEMLDGLAAAGLPPAHVGINAGPVLFQEGDYFGQTVNLTARIADYARPGEVLVSQAVADAAREAPMTFTEIGDVELKGVAGTVHLLRAGTR